MFVFLFGLNGDDRVQRAIFLAYCVQAELATEPSEQDAESHVDYEVMCRVDSGKCDETNVTKREPFAYPRLRKQNQTWP